MTPQTNSIRLVQTRKAGTTQTKEAKPPIRNRVASPQFRALIAADAKAHAIGRRLEALRTEIDEAKRGLA